jgi:hypothetical protein
MSMKKNVKSAARLVSLSGLYLWIIALVLAHMSAPVWGPVWAGIAQTERAPSPEKGSSTEVLETDHEESCLVIEDVRVCDPLDTGVGP